MQIKTTNKDDIPENIETSFTVKCLREREKERHHSEYNKAIVQDVRTSFYIRVYKFTHVLYKLYVHVLCTFHTSFVQVLYKFIQALLGQHSITQMSCYYKYELS